MQATQADTDTEHNMAVIRCYFGQISDNGKVAFADQVFAKDCIMHRPGVLITGIDDIKKFFAAVPRMCADFKTTFLDMFATGDRVAIRLKHDVTAAQDAVVPFRTGKYPVGGMKMSWTAMAIFRFKEGKVAEEWVERDSLECCCRSAYLSRTLKGEHSARLHRAIIKVMQSGGAWTSPATKVAQQLPEYPTSLD